MMSTGTFQNQLSFLPFTRRQFYAIKTSSVSRTKFKNACFHGHGKKRTLLSHTRIFRFKFNAAAADDPAPEEKQLVPGKPETAIGEQMAYYLEMEPQLFQTAMEDKLSKIKEARELRKIQAESNDTTTTSTTGEEAVSDKQDLVLYERMEEVRAREESNMLQDLMYLAVLEKFVALRVEMLPRMEGTIDVGSTDLKTLTEGVHSKEAIDLVREHVLSVMGPAAMAFSNAQLKLSKLQMAQVYAASVMFGYFLRKVDSRFQLERSVGVLTEIDTQDAAKKLEKLFQQAGDIESVENPDVVEDIVSEMEPKEEEPESTEKQNTKKEGKKKSPLRKYVESFDQGTLREMASIVSVEGAALVERQTQALFGDIKQLQIEMQNIVGQDVMSVEDLLNRVQEAVVQDTVSTLTMTVGTQRQAVLEAVAFGTFLRDVESWVSKDYGLLTSLPPPKPNSGGSGGGGGGGVGPLDDDLGPNAMGF